MAAIQEVAVTSCQNDNAVCVYAWDVLTGTTLMTYRGETPVAPTGLSLLAGEYVVAALQAKPFLRVWPVHSQQPLSGLRLVCPGRVTHALASPDNCYIALTVGDKLHTFQVASGKLVGTGVRHFQPVRVVRWSADGNLVVTGGEDGLVAVWTLATLATQNSPEPRHVMSDHTLPVTDLAVTAGLRPRLLSVSTDRTCKVYDLYQGTLLVSLVFDKMLTAVTTSILESEVFVGSESGDILQFSLLSPPRYLEYHLTADECAPVFTGHDKAVRSLSASLNGELLMSGSSDGSVRVWHIASRQCLRTIAHKGPVTNAFFTMKPKQMFDNELKPSVVINSFQTANSEKTDSVDVITEQTLSLCDDVIPDLFPPPASTGSEERVRSLQMEIDLLRSINSNLYKFSVDKIIAGNNVVQGALQVSTTEPVKKGKVKKKKKLKDQDKNKTKTNRFVVTVPVNGVTKKKRNRKRKKKAKTPKEN